MLKRHFCLFICVVALLFPSASRVHAQEADSSPKVTSYTSYFEDGSYYVTTIEEFSSTTSSRANELEKSGKKTISSYDSSSNLLYSLTVYGTFSYNGTTAKATSSSYTYTVDSIFWSFSSGSASHSGASATATGTYKLLGFLSTQKLEVRLTCSPSGTLS